MKVVVTGAFGFSGRAIARRLVERGYQVVTLTNRRPEASDPPIPAYPLDFKHPARLTEALRGAEALVNTYWIRFSYGMLTHERAVENSARLIEAARQAGVQRIVHISITNPSLDSPLPYFRGKAKVEKMIQAAGLSYAILRPTVFFGHGDILINNIAFLLRRFPVFFLPGHGRYRLQPVFVEDFAEQAVWALGRNENLILDVVGPETFSFRELLEKMSTILGLKRLLLPVPSRVALWSAQIMGRLLGDILLTQDELSGLMMNLLVSSRPPRGKTPLTRWLRENLQQVGKTYASELKRHYLR